MVSTPHLCNVRIANVAEPPVASIGSMMMQVPVFACGGNGSCDPDLNGDDVVKGRCVGTMHQVCGEDGKWMDAICPEYGTAMACFILQMPNNYLPIIQR